MSEVLRIITQTILELTFENMLIESSTIDEIDENNDVFFNLQVKNNMVTAKMPDSQENKKINIGSDLNIVYDIDIDNVILGISVEFLNNKFNDDWVVYVNNYINSFIISCINMIDNVLFDNATIDKYKVSEYLYIKFTFADELKSGLHLLQIFGIEIPVLFNIINIEEYIKDTISSYSEELYNDLMDFLNMSLTEPIIMQTINKTYEIDLDNFYEDFPEGNINIEDNLSLIKHMMQSRIKRYQLASLSDILLLFDGEFWNLQGVNFILEHNRSEQIKS